MAGEPGLAARAPSHLARLARSALHGDGWVRVAQEARLPREDPRDTLEPVQQPNPVIGDLVLVDRAVVSLAAELDHQDPATQLPLELQIAHRDDRVSDSR